MGGPASLAQEPAAQDIKKDRAKTLTTVVYDIRDIVAKPTILGMSGRLFRDVEPAPKAVGIVRAILSVLDPINGTSTTLDRETIEVLNGTRLVIRASAACHAEIPAILKSLRAQGDVAVSVETHLYEVDEAYYNKLKNAKHISLEESERLFFEGIHPASASDSLFNLLPKQKKVMDGEKIQVNSGEDAPILSWHQAVRSMASPEQLRKGEKSPQTLLEGVSFVANMEVNSDRRSVRLKLIEKAAELEGIQKTKLFMADGKEVAAEIPLFKEHTQTRVKEIPDHGSLLVPVLYQPSSAREKSRWWVLSITPHIVIEAEENAISKVPVPRP